MALYSIDPSLNKSEEIADMLNYLITDDRKGLPKLKLQEIIFAKKRLGLDPDIISSTIISRFPEIGIPNGVLQDGTPNVMEKLVSVICEELVDAIQNQMRVDIAVDPGMQVISQGASASGPVLSNGSNLQPHTAIGVAR
jgi:hypothetical protein